MTVKVYRPSEVFLGTDSHRKFVSAQIIVEKKGENGVHPRAHHFQRPFNPGLSDNEA